MKNDYKNRLEESANAFIAAETLTSPPEPVQPVRKPVEKVILPKEEKPAVKKPTTKQKPKAKKEKAPEPQYKIEDLPLKRQTHFFTYAELEAINEQAHRERVQKSDFVRALLDEILEQKYPGLLKEMEPWAIKAYEKDLKEGKYHKIEEN